MPVHGKLEREVLLTKLVVGLFPVVFSGESWHLEEISVLTGPRLMFLFCFVFFP